MQSQPHDRLIPSIEFLFDEQAISARLKELFNWKNVTELRREYLRYKPSSSCLCLYQVKHGNKHHLLYLKAYSEKVKVEKAQLKSQSSTPLAANYSHVFTAENLVLNRYPFDTHLPALEQLVDVSQRQKLLERTFFDTTETQNTLLTPLQYKPERRFVAKLTLHNGAHVVVKLYTPDRYQSLSLSYLKRPSSPFGKLLGKSDKHCMLIYEWVEGTKLHQQDPLTAEQLKQYYLCGQQLAQFHLRQAPKKVPRVDTRHFAGLIRSHAQSINTILPQQSDLTLWLADQLARQLRAAKKENCFIHGDFYAEQVLITAEQIEFLDFDNLSRWFSAFDVGNFLAHLLYKSEIGLISKRNYDKILRIFLDGYCGKREIDQHQLDLFIAIGLFQLIYHPLRFGLPNWQLASSRLLSETFIHLSHSQSEQSECSFRQLVARSLDPTLIQQRLNAQQGESITVYQAILSRFKEDKRALIEYDLSSESDNRIIGKIRAKGLDKRSWQNQEALFDGEFGCNAKDRIHVPEPLFAINELNIWFQKKVAGERVFTPFCESTDADLPHHLALAIYKLHNTTLLPDKQHLIDKELKILDDALSNIINTQPNLESRIRHLLKLSVTLSEHLTTSLVKPIHRDFYHDQVLWDGKKLHLLDFDLLCLGSPYLDLGNFIAHIQEQCLRVYNDPFYAQQSIDQFISRYLLLCGHHEADREIEIYRLLTWLRHIAISQRIPQRKPFTEQIIHFCEQQIQAFLSQQ